MKKLLLAIAGFLSAHKAFAAVVVGAASALPAIAIGADPWPWAIGASGGAFVYLMRDPVSRKQAFGNTMFSMVLGGIAAPIVAMAVQKKFELFEVQGVELLFAIVFGWGWPWLIEVGLPLLKKKAGLDNA